MPDEKCSRCHLYHPRPESAAEGIVRCIEAQRQAMLTLLMRIADRACCSAPECKAPIFWVNHANGKKVPYTEAGLNHFIDCPGRERFRNFQKRNP